MRHSSSSLQPPPTASILGTESAEALDTFFERLQSVRAEINRNSKLIRRFIDDSALIKRTEDASAPGHATSTAFSLYYLLRGNEPHDVTSSIRGVSKDDLLNATRQLGKSIETGHVRRDSDGNETSTGELPNQYNSTIQVAGFLKASRILGSEVVASQATACQTVISFVSEIMSRTAGYVPRLETDAQSAYLSYWAGAAILEWKLYRDERGGNDTTGQDPDELLSRLSDWSEGQVARYIAFHYSGLKSRFDVIELLYSAICTVAFRHSPDAEEVARHALDVIFDGYFADGCLAPSAPVLADKENFALQCPTLGLLLLVTTTLPLKHADRLCSTHEWLARNRSRSRVV